MPTRRSKIAMAPRRPCLPADCLFHVFVRLDPFSIYRWPFGPIPMGARSPTHISPTRTRYGPEYYWARAGTGTIAGSCLGLNPDPWTRPSTARKSRPDRPDGRHGGPGTAHGPLPRTGQQKSRWRPAADPAQRSGYIRGAGRCPRPPPGLHSLAPPPTPLHSPRGLA